MSKSLSLTPFWVSQTKFIVLKDSKIIEEREEVLWGCTKTSKRKLKNEKQKQKKRRKVEEIYRRSKSNIILIQIYLCYFAAKCRSLHLFSLSFLMLVFVHVFCLHYSVHLLINLEDSVFKLHSISIIPSLLVALHSLFIVFGIIISTSLQHHFQH
jgi:hypothetical protein